VIAHLFVPRNSVSPFQTVIYFPSAVALAAKSSEELEMQVIEFLLRSGRAVLYPVYKGTYERNFNLSGGSSSWRDLIVCWSKDFSRSIDYLQTHPDIDREKLAFYGLSIGGVYGPVLTAIDGRIKVSVHHAGGFQEGKLAPEIDTLHFASRAIEPALMI